MSFLYQTETLLIMQADALDLPIESSTVDLIVTSPPYFGVRSYEDKGEAYEGQIGMEDTYGQYLDGLVKATSEMMRVLKDTGSIWVNLGDIYNKKTKSLLGLPWRYANRCVDELGLILRADVIWDKVNVMPTRVNDRVRITHEYWFHFTKTTDYFCDLDPIREPFTEGTLKRAKSKYSGGQAAGKMRHNGDEKYVYTPNPLGKIPGSVWKIGMDDRRLYSVKKEHGKDKEFPLHIAIFPMEWPKRLVSSWCPKDGTVLDPFGGSGTTAGVAQILGRKAINIDLSEDYCRLAKWRIEETDHFEEVVKEKQ